MSEQFERGCAVEALNPMTPIQLILTIFLLGLLVTWMVTFFVLAIRPEAIKRPTVSIQETQNEYASHLSYASTLAPEAIATSSEHAPAMMQMITVPPTRAHS